MASTLAYRRGLATAVAASATASYVYASQSSLHLEDGSASKLPIYSSQPEPVLLAEVRGPLEDQVAAARRAIANTTQGARDAVQGQVSRWIRLEKSVEKKVSSLIPNDEALTPGLLYVGIATLSGSVFTRYRSLPLRLLAPPLLFVGSLNYFLPKTSHNLGQYYLELENDHLPPAVRAQRESLIARWQQTRSAAEEQYVKAREGTGDLVHRSLQGVEESTGLKVGGGGQSVPNKRAGGGDRLV